jgi:dehydrogenase/reductase SDR family member 4
VPHPQAGWFALAAPAVARQIPPPPLRRPQISPLMPPAIPPRFDLTGKTAVITGATRGIGRAITFALARAGAAVVVSSRKAPAVASTTDEIRAEGLEATGIVANVGRLDEAHALVDQAIAAYGGIDIVVNNAAANPVYGPMIDTTAEAFEKIMSVNLKAAFEISRRSLPSMIARGGGSVVNLSSIGGISPEPGLGIYSVSKAALISLTKVMAHEWGKHGVRANAICPGLIRTDFSATLWKNEAVAGHMIAELPLPRIGEPDDVAGLALFLASDAGSYCTGSVYMVDGGYLS